MLTTLIGIGVVPQAATPIILVPGLAVRGEAHAPKPEAAPPPTPSRAILEGVAPHRERALLAAGLLDDLAPMYVCMCIYVYMYIKTYIYIYIYIYVRLAEGARGPRPRPSSPCRSDIYIYIHT